MSLFKCMKHCNLKEILILVLFLTDPVLSVWKNIRAGKQCLCKFFPTLGTICAIFYAVLSQKISLCRNFALCRVILMGLKMVKC